MKTATHDYPDGHYPVRFSFDGKEWDEMCWCAAERLSWEWGGDVLIEMS